MSVEGPPEISTYKKAGEIKPAVSLMAKWSHLSGHGGQRQRKSEAGKKAHDDQQAHRNNGDPISPEPPPFDNLPA